MMRANAATAVALFGAKCDPHEIEELLMTDTTSEPAREADLLSLTTNIVVAFLANTKVDPVAVPEVISATHAALVRLTVPQVEAITEPTPEKPNRAAIRRSVTEDGIVSFLDGKTYKMLSRHLRLRGYTPDSYREEFGLPADYPIVASGYSALRSAKAKEMGLGLSRKGTRPKRRPKSTI